MGLKFFEIKVYEEIVSNEFISVTCDVWISVLHNKDCREFR